MTPTETAADKQRRNCEIAPLNLFIMYDLWYSRQVVQKVIQFTFIVEYITVCIVLIHRQWGLDDKWR